MDVSILEMNEFWYLLNKESKVWAASLLKRHGLTSKLVTVAYKMIHTGKSEREFNCLSMKHIKKAIINHQFVNRGKTMIDIAVQVFKLLNFLKSS
jgi:hypothetical protein